MISATAQIQSFPFKYIFFDKYKYMHIASSYNLVYSKSLFKRRSMNLCIRKCKCKCKYAKILLNRVHSWWEILNRKWTETQTNRANFLLRHTIQSLISHIEARDTQTVKIRALYISTLLLMYQKDWDYFYWFKKKIGKYDEKRAWIWRVEL